ncbi:MFS transporter [Sutcliffiella horikoshii]|uniref:staphylopine family metallophore export MFS transporter CntE n=1 Tax=Sutcliffiella horikoshii TaxID=79883 RepID=UPI00203C3522|nr:MFS transporter [Sutcliffiella horikoshii]MCM3618316.1 MFS transporter [Sutcliffiella horikoshii]
MKGALSWPFMRLYILVFFYFSANAILNVIIPLQGKALGATNTTIGLIMGAYLFTTMFLRPWAGHLIARYGPIPILRTILVVNGIALVLYAVTGLGGYAFARILQGVCTAFFSMALQIGIMDALPEKDRSQGISLYSLFSYIPGIVGPLLALGIWQEGMGTFGMVMVTLAIVTGIIGFTAKVGEKQEVKGSAPTLGMGKAIRQLVDNSDLTRSCTLMLFGSIVFGATTIFIPLYALQVPSGNAGIFLMLMAATVVVSRFTLRKSIPSDGKWHSTFMIGTMLLLTIGTLSISYAVEGGAGFFYFGAIVVGVAQALLYPSLTTYLSLVLPKASRNVLLGLFIASADLGVSMGGAVMGPVADLTSYSTVYLVCSVLGGIMAVVAYRQG